MNRGPSDAPAEQIIICAVLEGHAQKEHLEGLESEHFSVGLFRILFAVGTSLLEGKLEPTNNRIRHALDGMKIYVPNLDRELRIIRLETPAVLRLRPTVERVIRTAKHRGWTERLQLVASFAAEPTTLDPSAIPLLEGVLQEMRGSL